jgi:hypothetical protein
MKRRRELTASAALAVGAIVALMMPLTKEDEAISAPKRTRVARTARSIPILTTNGAAPVSLIEGRPDDPVLGQIHQYFPNRKPRPASEWQGMLVDLASTPPCQTSADCGLARACVDGRCTACTSDSDCAPQEACVLDHCVRATLTQCRKASDCGTRGPCMLSGYTPDLRGNAGLQSFCVADKIRTQERPNVPADSYVSGPSPGKRLLESLSSHANR